MRARAADSCRWSSPAVKGSWQITSPGSRQNPLKAHMDAETKALSRSLVVELAGSVGFRNSPLVQQLAWILFRPVTNRLARIGVTFDQDAVQYGFSAAMG